MPLLDLTDENFDDEIERYKLTVLDFWAPWCAPCTAFAPVFSAAAARHSDILFGRIDTETQQTLAKQFAVQSVPTLLAAKDGTILQCSLSALPSDKLEAMIANLRSS